MNPDLATRLASITPARLSLHRAGAASATADLLRFQVDHALARDAVRRPLETVRLLDELTRVGCLPRLVPSRAHDLDTHLRRPDLGRLPEFTDLESLPPSPDGVLVVSGGLSAGAVERYVPSVVQSLGWPGLVVLVPYGRVAIGDPIGAHVGAAWSLVLLGERPGLSAPESLGAYLTLSPRPGRTDAERECLSNIRTDGTPPELAAQKLREMILRAVERGATGVLPPSIP